MCIVHIPEGQYYVPRAYYTIDAEGHESAHVPLRRLRRSLQPYPYASSAHATANANAESGEYLYCNFLTLIIFKCYVSDIAFVS